MTKIASRLAGYHHRLIHSPCFIFAETILWTPCIICQANPLRVSPVGFFKQTGFKTICRRPIRWASLFIPDFNFPPIFLGWRQFFPGVFQMSWLWAHHFTRVPQIGASLCQQIGGRGHQHLVSRLRAVIAIGLNNPRQKRFLTLNSYRILLWITRKQLKFNTYAEYMARNNKQQE